VVLAKKFIGILLSFFYLLQFMFKDEAEPRESYSDSDKECSSAFWHCLAS